jgi:hypothetical protein
VTVALSIFLFVVGAILFLTVNTLALILMILGALGVVFSLLQQALWARQGRRPEPVVDDRPDTEDPRRPH